VITLPADLKAAALAVRTKEVVLAFVTISHADIATPIRIVNNSVAVTRGGLSLEGRNLSIDFPGDNYGNESPGRLTVDDVDLAIKAKIRALTSAPTVSIYIALASAPDTAYANFGTYLWKPISWNNYAVTGDLRYYDALDILIPCDCFTPTLVPGVY
jgi:hypothetical protein